MLRSSRLARRPILIAKNGMLFRELDTGSGKIRGASTLFNSTPHWSNESMFQIVPWAKMLCS
jgi:hypothetical protein